MKNENIVFHLRLHRCKCGATTAIQDMDMKMGGLLCPECRTILFQPYVDEEYFAEYRRRNSEREKEASKGGQEGVS